mgnify:FL=1
MAYLSKDAVLAAYHRLSKLSADPSAQGQTQLVSALRYFVALDRYYFKYTKDCDTRSANDKDSYTQYVGEVVGVTDELYTGNFYFPLIESQGDYNCGSNFYSVNVVTLSKENNTETYEFPRRGRHPLINVHNGNLKRNRDYYVNLNHYLPNSDVKAAFVIWLLRFDVIGSQDFNGIRGALANKYTEELVDTLMPANSNTINAFKPYQLFANSKCSLSNLDIRDKIVAKTKMKPAASGSKVIAYKLTPTILYGPPGTGKTYQMQTKYINRFEKDNCFVTTFHQSFSYEDFVEGLKPLLDGYDSENITYQIEQGIFKRACERAALIAGFNSLEESITHPDRVAMYETAIKEGQLVLLCIDEINRANVTAVFGDLISLIEDSKRIGSKNELTVKLPYSKKEFGVPRNLLILGTMNTADRSIQLLDTALRRRFAFEELLPEYAAIENQTAKDILQAINNRLRALLNKDCQIGHAYFTQVRRDDGDFIVFEVVRDKIIPLLEEYFYNEISRIRLVLNENSTTINGKAFYVEDKLAKRAYDAMGLDEEVEFYSLDNNLKIVSTDNEASEYLKHIAE